MRSLPIAKDDRLQDDDRDEEKLREDALADAEIPALPDYFGLPLDIPLPIDF